jgi:glycosyltransferase involved in cell wall biosynthesis
MLVNKDLNKLLIIVPAYNEEKNLDLLWDNFTKSKINGDILVVNDCSTDNTQQVADKLGANVINLPFNLGIGGAMQTGYRYAYDNNYNYAIQVDGDGQHRPSEINKLIDAMSNNNADLVIGSRFVSKTDYRGSITRRVGISVFAFMTKILIGQSIKDATSGFRLANREVIKCFADNYPSDYPEPEVLVILKRMGFKIIEVPVEMSDRLEGKSSITSAKSIYYMIKVIFAMFISRIRKV